VAVGTEYAVRGGLYGTIFRIYFYGRESVARGVLVNDDSLTGQGKTAYGNVVKY
jgi:hypothetical protein